jgi:uncharacterized cupin superfamily protein
MTPILNLADIVLTPQAHGEKFACETGQIGRALGAELLGCRLVTVPPGKRGWPLHSHFHNEEIFVILSGGGTLRLGEGTHAVREGDVIICRAGGAETAHQLIAGEEALRYLAISTMNQPDICLYPDSGKVWLSAGAPPGGAKDKRRLDHMTRLGEDLDYWDGE